MATFKPIVSKYKKEDGTHRVYIRITHNRQYRDIATPFYVDSTQITRSLKLKDISILEQVEKEILVLRNNAVKIGFVANDVGVDDFIKLLYNRPDSVDFFDVINERIAIYIKDGQEGTAYLHKYAASLLKRFNQDRPLYFSNLTANFMLRFYESICSSLRANTLRSVINNIGADYRYALKKYNNNEAGIQVVRYGVMDLIPTNTIKITQAKDNVIPDVVTMQALIDCPYHNGVWYELAKDMYILCFLCFGTNVADLMQIRKEQLRDGILSYRRKKTARRSGDSADILIKILPVAQIIIDKYLSKDDYLINSHFHKNWDFIVRRIHYYFEEIGLESKEEQSEALAQFGHSRYTFYSNRHTMASFARNICGVDYMTVHQMLNHAAPSEFRTTDTYLARDFRPLWEANEKLYNLFDWSFYLNQAK